jgi:hypothetical protein
MEESFEAAEGICGAGPVVALDIAVVVLDTRFKVLVEIHVLHGMRSHFGRVTHACTGRRYFQPQGVLAALTAVSESENASMLLPDPTVPKSGRASGPGATAFR